MGKITGNLIVFEGPDGVGKTTTANALVTNFNSQGIKSVCLAFPGNEAGTLGNLVYDVHHHLEKYNIKSIPVASLQLLHIAAHIDAIESRILPLLHDGQNVILDRYWWSTWVYGVVDGADLNVIKAMIDVEKLAWKNTKPNWIFVIDRKHSLRKDEAEDRWQKLKKAYRELIRNEEHNNRIALVENEDSAEVTLAKVIHIIDGKKYS